MNEEDARDLRALDSPPGSQPIPQNWLTPRGAAGWITAAAVASVTAWLGWSFAPALALPTMALVMPALLLWGARRGGAAAAALGTAALSAAIAYSTPAWTAGCAPLVLLPAIVFRYVCARRRLPFSTTWVGCLACLLGSAMLAFRLVWARLGDSPVTYALAALERWLNTSSQAGATLLEAYRFGLARIGSEPFALQFGSGVWIAPSQRGELINSLISTLGALAQSYLPTAFISGSVLGATLCAAVSPDGSPNGAPPFAKWRIPFRGPAGIFMSVALVLFALNLLSGGAFEMASSLAVAAAQTGLQIQGAAALESRLGRHGLPLITRRALIVVCFAILGIFLTILGLVVSLRHTRRTAKPEGGEDSAAKGGSL
ncbi:MAG: hypothetical protein LBS11_02615 [Oscillospiraceae bacterium]|jgi:hypothetical protein|nr:hypothetical protein [Oscillospiraceae bacterium]